jgi:hypothetical protein
MDFIPPENSKIIIKQIGAERALIIPHANSIVRYFFALFMLFWLGGWVAGFNHAFSQIMSGKADSFLIFWIGGWTLGGIFAVYFLYRLIKPPVNESIQLGIDRISYDSGVPPFQFQQGFRNQKEMWKSMFPKRTKIEINKDALRSLKLRDTDSGNRLTIDVGINRLDIATGVSEIEREWLYQLLSKNYS